MIARSFYFLRHGETDANVQQLLQGSMDTLLNDNGREQARLAAQILKNHPIDRIIASPLKRVIETANIVNQILQKPIEFDGRLQEKCFGLYEGKNREQIEQWKKDNNYIDPPIEHQTGFPAPPQGENYETFSGRILNAVMDGLAKYPDENVLFVSHGGVFTALHFHFWENIVKTKNAHPYHFRYAPEKWHLECLVTPYKDVFCA
ncbi:MAG TPA: histidine phosphatase family protein [Alphaproteobacteria bacterium]